MNLSNAKNDQLNFKSRLGRIKKVVKNQKSRTTICNIDTLYKARKGAIKFFDDYSSMVSEAKLK